MWKRRPKAKTSERADVIVIHDAARPFVTDDIITRTIDAAETHGDAGNRRTVYNPSALPVTISVDGTLREVASGELLTLA